MANLIILTNVDGMVWQRSMGGYQVANHCRSNNISCQVIDFTDMFSNKDLYQIVKKFIDNETLAIGISTSFYRKRNKINYIDTDVNQLLNNDPIEENILFLFNKIKYEYPKIKIIAGGANSYLVKDNIVFDAVFHGYSEQSVVDYLIGLKSSKKKIYDKIKGVNNIEGSSGHFDITGLKHHWSVQDCILPNETLPIEISRGCIFKCKFCSYPLNGKKKFDYLRDPEHIKEELIKNYETFGTTNYFFTDDTFNDSTFKLERLYKVFSTLSFKIKFVTYLRLDLIHAHKEQIQLLKEMGLGSAFFGIETLNHSSAKIIGKGMNSEFVKEFLVDLHDTDWKKEIPFTCSFIIGLPGESKESIMRSWDWIKNQPFQDLWFPLRISKGTYYQSEFDINFKDFGYEIDENGFWYNGSMNYVEAKELAEEFNNFGFYGKKPPSTWFLFCLLSHGYTIEQVKEIPNRDLPWKKFLLQKHRMFKKYHNLLKEL